MSQMIFEKWLAILTILTLVVVMLVSAGIGQLAYVEFAFAFAGPVVIVMAARRLFRDKPWLTPVDRLLAVLVPFLVFSFVVNGTYASIELFDSHKPVFGMLVPAAVAISLLVWKPAGWVERDMYSGDDS